MGKKPTWVKGHYRNVSKKNNDASKKSFVKNCQQSQQIMPMRKSSKLMIWSIVCATFAVLGCAPIIAIGIYYLIIGSTMGSPENFIATIILGIALSWSAIHLFKKSKDEKTKEKEQSLQDIASPKESLKQEIISQYKEEMLNTTLSHVTNPLIEKYEQDKYVFSHEQEKIIHVKVNDMYRGTQIKKGSTVLFENPEVCIFSEDDECSTVGLLPDWLIKKLETVPTAVYGEVLRKEYEESPSGLRGDDYVDCVFEIKFNLPVYKCAETGKHAWSINDDSRFPKVLDGRKVLKKFEGELSGVIEYLDAYDDCRINEELKLEIDQESKYEYSIKAVRLNGQRVGWLKRGADNFMKTYKQLQNNQPVKAFIDSKDQNGDYKYIEISYAAYSARISGGAN